MLRNVSILWATRWLCSSPVSSSNVTCFLFMTFYKYSSFSLDEQWTSCIHTTYTHFILSMSFIILIKFSHYGGKTHGKKTLWFVFATTGKLYKIILWWNKIHWPVQEVLSTLSGLSYFLYKIILWWNNVHRPVQEVLSI